MIIFHVIVKCLSNVINECHCNDNYNSLSVLTLTSQLYVRWSTSSNDNYLIFIYLVECPTITSTWQFSWLRAICWTVIHERKMLPRGNQRVCILQRFLWRGKYYCHKVSNGNELPLLLRTTEYVVWCFKPCCLSSGFHLGSTVTSKPILTLG